MGANELPPEMLAQAQMLGGQRAPTQHEIAEAQKSMIAMAHVQVASAVATAMLDSGYDTPAELASNIATAILDRSEENELDTRELTSVRNQLAVGLICADIRGGGLNVRQEPTSIVGENFETAEAMISSGQLYAQKQISQLSK
jgi:hypothetical protein